MSLFRRRLKPQAPAAAGASAESSAIMADSEHHGDHSHEPAAPGAARESSAATDELDTSRLRPGIRSAWTGHRSALEAKRDDPTGTLGRSTRVATRPMTAGLVRTLVWDTPVGRTPVTEGELDAWNISFDDLWPVAVANLAKHPTAGGWTCAESQVWVSLDDDDYAAERIFIDGHLDATDIGARAVMFRPNRNTLIAVDDGNAEGLRIAVELAAQRADMAAPLSLVPAVGRDLRWEALRLSPHHPAAPGLERLQATQNAHVYAEQQPLLRATSRNDVFVADYEVQSLGGRVVSCCRWPEGTETLLPRTDLIAFESATGDRLVVEWAAANTIIGHHMEATNHFPDRIRVTSFPQLEELLALRSLARHD